MKKLIPPKTHRDTYNTNEKLYMTFLMVDMVGCTSATTEKTNKFRGITERIVYSFDGGKPEWDGDKATVIFCDTEDRKSEVSAVIAARQIFERSMFDIDSGAHIAITSSIAPYPKNQRTMFNYDLNICGHLLKASENNIILIDFDTYRALPTEYQTSLKYAGTTKEDGIIAFSSPNPTNTPLKMNIFHLMMMKPIPHLLFGFTII